MQVGAVCVSLTLMTCVWLLQTYKRLKVEEISTCLAGRKGRGTEGGGVAGLLRECPVRMIPRNTAQLAEAGLHCQLLKLTPLLP